MLSRIADSLFWLNRYMERADGMLRVMHTHYILSLDKGVNGNITWRPVLQIFTTCNEEKIAALENDTAGVLQHLIVNTENNNSLRVLLTRARENARGVQDHISKEVWEQVNQAYHAINRDALLQRLSGDNALKEIELLAQICVSYTGITDITMPRGAGWCFMNLGKFIERCMETITLTEKQFFADEFEKILHRDILEWRYLLLSLSGYELHLKNYRSNNFYNNVLHQVLFNENFPRSVLYSLNRVEKYLDDVLKENNLAENQALLRTFGRLYSKVKYTDPQNFDKDSLHQFLLETKQDLQVFSKQFAQNFFSYS